VIKQFRKTRKIHFRLSN